MDVNESAIYALSPIMASAIDKPVGA